jgi:molybdopterin/thiamine biosynthesis adenylyltransferase
MKPDHVSSPPFDYGEAFSRNLGWVTETEQQVLRSKRIAMAGMGGVGAHYLLTLTRLGIARFTISDFDVYELGNFNRQAGATLSHLDRPKVEVMAEMALDINPELDLRKFPGGIDSDNLDEFLDGVDLYIDTLDFFALEARRQVFAACAERGIPAITVAPIGMGAALLSFLPGGMTFEEYFRLEGQPEDEQLLRFLLGLSPAMLQMPYVADDTRVDLEARKVPSTPMGCELCAGVAATNALKILLNRGDVVTAPWGLHFDAYRNKLKRTWRPGGNNNPLQKLGLKIARKRFSARAEIAHEPKPETALERILDLARWAPSGDNEQPWRFETLGPAHFAIHGHDTRDWCVYDLDGRASQRALGALLETIAIAASGEGLKASFQRREASPETAPVFDVQLTAAPMQPADALLPYIPARTTQRRPMRTGELSPAQKRQLEDCLGEGYQVHWLEGRPLRRRVAGLLFRNAHIRLTTEEAYRVHRRTIEWGAQFSEDRIPERAVGADPLTMKIMQWALQSWGRVRFLNRFMAGTWLPRLQMDWLTGLQCSCHFVIYADKPLNNIDKCIEGGRAIQRFWLTATRLGLQFQPEMTPVIFSGYDREGLSFSADTDKLAAAARLRQELEGLVGANVAANAAFMGRLGFGPAPQSRSIRKPLERLRAAS